MGENCTETTKALRLAMLDLCSDLKQNQSSVKVAFWASYYYLHLILRDGQRHLCPSPHRHWRSWNDCHTPAAWRGAAALMPISFSWRRKMSLKYIWAGHFVALLDDSRAVDTWQIGHLKYVFKRATTPPQGSGGHTFSIQFDVAQPANGYSS